MIKQYNVSFIFHGKLLWFTVHYFTLMNNTGICLFTIYNWGYYCSTNNYSFDQGSANWDGAYRDGIRPIFYIYKYFSVPLGLTIITYSLRFCTDKWNVFYRLHNSALLPAIIFPIRAHGSYACAHKGTCLVESNEDSVWIIPKNRLKKKLNFNLTICDAYTVKILTENDNVIGMVY